MNPHASDGGLFGDEEARILAPAARRLAEQGVDISEPLPADTVFGRALRGGGSLYVATDWQNYAEHIDELLADTPLFELEERREHRGDRPLDRETTKFEKRGLGKGHAIWDWHFLRTGENAN